MERCAGKSTLLAAEAGGDLAASQSEDLRVHLASCPSCRRQLAEYEYVLQLSRASFPKDLELSAPARTRIAAAASARALAGPLWQRWLARPLRPVLAGATVAAVVLLAGLLARRSGEPPTVHSSRGPVQLEMFLERDGQVRLAWKDGGRQVYTVRKSSDPRGFASVETHKVRGNTWVDKTPASSPVVFYQVD